MAPKSYHTVVVLLLLSILFSARGQSSCADVLYSELQGSKPSKELFAQAYQGAQSLKQTDTTVRDSILIIIDFSLASTEKRIWVINTLQKKTVYHQLVAHGKNSGTNMATQMSNTNGSHQSSQGFYLTAETYSGKHGFSLRLDGMDAGYNDQARERNIVMHSADYVSAAFVKQHGRCGRSWGCPAVPKAEHEWLIDYISNKAPMLIYFPNATWQSSCKWLKDKADC